MPDSTSRDCTSPYNEILHNLFYHFTLGIYHNLCDIVLCQVWNFNNGALLKEMSTLSSDEISGIVFMPSTQFHKYIVSVGWDQKVLLRILYLVAHISDCICIIY